MDYSHLQGWVDDQKAVEKVMNQLPFPVFTSLYPPLKDTGKGKIQLLHTIVSKVNNIELKNVLYRHQKIGDCVSMGAACGVDVVKCVDIYLKKDPELWIAETSTEDIYYGSRVVIGKGRLGNSDGSVGAWAAKWINEYGVIPRDKYGKTDLSKYDGDRAREWGAPNFKIDPELLSIIKQHPIETVSLVKTYEEARDLIYNGYAVTVASNIGFENKRDSEGFSRRSGNWNHQMCFISCDDEYKRPGLLCNNSWGNWISGPRRHDQPSGSFWVDADTVNAMLRQGDSWGLSGYKGFRVQKLNTRII